MKLLIFTSILLLSACSVKRTIVSKPYIAVEVNEQLTGTYYNFINLSYTHGRQFYLNDTAMCNAGDTILIKDYKHGIFSKQTTIFINYKN
jgi:hypothetical protein